MSTTDRDWLAVAERLAADAAQGSPILPAGRLRHVSGVTPAALARWAVDGKRGVYLDAVRGPGKAWNTTAFALARFFASLSALEAGKYAPPPPGEFGRRRRAAIATAELRARGVPV